MKEMEVVYWGVVLLGMIAVAARVALNGMADRRERKAKNPHAIQP